MTIDPAVARNALRYLSGALVARGLISAQTGAQIASDAMIVEAMTIGAGLAIGALAELFYAFARRFGWRT